METEKIVFATDEHYPFHDGRAREVALQITQDFNPTEMIVGSDGLDFYGLSTFVKNPARLKEANLQNEIDQWSAGQRDWISAAPNAKRRYTPGNHETRLADRIKELIPELYSLRVLGLSTLLDFRGNKIPGGVEREIVYRTSTERLVVRHGSLYRPKSGYTAYGEIEKSSFSASVMVGHTHRGGTVYHTTPYNGVVIGQECFCLCTIPPGQNWQQGIVLAEVSETGISIEPVKFTYIAGSVYGHWRGKTYRST